MKKIVGVLLALMLTLTSFAEDTQSQTVKNSGTLISYQGKIENLGHNNLPLTKTGAYNVTFRLYNEHSKEAVWSEVKNLEIVDGIINTNLGDVKSFSSDIFGDKLYLTLEINGEETGKQLLTGSPYSMIANRISKEAIVAGSGISVKKLDDGKLEISGEIANSKGSDRYSGNDWNFYTGGTNNWIFHTPDDGRKDMCIINSDHLSPNTEPSNWSSQVVFKKDGVVNFGRNVGIGIGLDTPISTLDLNKGSFRAGDIRMPDRGSSYDYIRLKNSGDAYLGGFMFSKENGFFGRNNSLVLYSQTRDLTLRANGGDVYIGGGRSADVQNLRVNGSVFAKEIQVKTNTFPDYVFEKEYKLTSLEEIENHIAKHGRLPGMPSAAEVTENGMNLKDIQLKLVEKVEELTLYMIQLKKENEELKKQMNR